VSPQCSPWWLLMGGSVTRYFSVVSFWPPLFPT
jgi:hypothetical protein